MNMKKLLYLFFALSVTLGLNACSTADDPVDEPPMGTPENPDNPNPGTGKTPYRLLQFFHTVTAQHAFDVHCHNVLPEFKALLDRHDAALEETFPLPDWDVASYLKFMEAAGIRTSLLSMPAPQPYFGDTAECRKMVRLYNEACAKLKADHPDKFLFCASLPLPDVEAAVEDRGLPAAPRRVYEICDRSGRSLPAYRTGRTDDVRCRREGESLPYHYSGNLREPGGLQIAYRVSTFPKIQAGDVAHGQVAGAVRPDTAQPRK